MQALHQTLHTKPSLVATPLKKQTSREHNEVLQERGPCAPWASGKRPLPCGLEP